jgi:YidC/Oxa1 family membrane protein insertase
MVDLTNASIFNQLLVWPIANLLIALYKGISLLGIPGSFGWAIIGLTLLIRTAIQPLTNKQMESTRKMQELKPKIDLLQKKYKNDKQKLQTEQMKLYQEHGINPAAGCLPLLIQMPIIFGLFQAFRGILLDSSPEHAVSAINQIVYFPWLTIDSLNVMFFGIDLTLFPNTWQEKGIWLLLIPVITGALTWYQTKMMTTSMQQPAKVDKSKTVKKEEKKPEDMAAEMQKQMGFIMPIMIGVFSYSFPIGIALYWNTYTVFAILTQKHTVKLKKA